MTNEIKNEITTVIIDDLESFRCKLINLLSDYGDIKIVAEADSVKSGLDVILNHQPDLVFLDINMEDDDSGIQLATQIRETPSLFKPPCIVFMTAYIGHDYPSIAKNTPINFLKKPIEPDEVLYTISAVKAVLENRDEEKAKIWYMVTEGDYKYMIEPIKEIIYIDAFKNSTFMCIEGDRVFKTNLKLEHYEKIFEPINICRVSKSSMVNLYKIDSIVGIRAKEKGPVTRHEIIIKNHETRISLGKTYYDKIISKLKNLK